ncbi:MAG TPA: hypothetical protein VNO83_21500, partial [Pseudonocardia sp.]|nr:hypothetical protein [Pseudonocardia sp.]
MGVDSGLPDFRGPEGFWRAYPPYRRLGLGFTDLADPVHFVDDPELAWGFYGHRLALYRCTTPHAGFAVLRRWAGRGGRGGDRSTDPDQRARAADPARPWGAGRRAGGGGDGEARRPAVTVRPQPAGRWQTKIAVPGKRAPR